MERWMRNLLWMGFLIVVALAVARVDLRPLKQGRPFRLAYSQLLVEVRAGRILDATLEGRGVTGRLVSGDRYSADAPDDATRGRLLAALEAQHERQPSLTFDVRSPAVSERLQSVFVSVLIPLGVIVLLWVLFWRHAQQGAGPTPIMHGFSSAHLRTEEVADVSWVRAMLTLTGAARTVEQDRRNWFGVAEALPELDLQPGDLVRFRPVAAASTGDLMVFAVGNVKHVRRCDDGDTCRFTGGPPLSEEARALGRVDLVVRSVPRV